MNMGAQGYSSEDSGSMKFSVQHFPVMPVDLTTKVEESELNTTTITTKTSAYLPRANSIVKDYFQGKKVAPTNTKYNVKLSVQYETQIGEHLVVVGNIDPLGNWTDMTKCIMKWTDGHVWVTENLVTDKPYFLYKYVICQGLEAIMWEKGANRIADVEVLEDLTDTQKDPRITPSPSMVSMNSSKLSSISRKSDRSRRASISPTKSPVRNSLRHVEIYDEWEHFKIKFSINDPVEEEILSQGDFMRIIGSIPKLGSQNVGEMESTPPMRMSRTQRPIEWLVDKYGQKMRPWEITIRFQMNELELPNEIIYSYSKSNESGNSIIKEREPSRSMIIQQPESYKGEIGIQQSNQFKNQQKVWIVNGAIEKADANFLGSLYFDKIGDTGLSVGTYPLREEDVSKMKKAGITGILNLQTRKDIEQRGIPWSNLKQIYEKQGIKCNRYPINDNDEDSLCASLFVAAQHLNNLINKEKLNVYLHCTSGISRAPAVALVYLCLFKRVKQWQNPQYVAQFVRAFHINSNPNMRAVNRVVEANLDFQSKQTDFQHELKIKQTKSEGIDGEEDFSGFYLPQQKPDAHRNSMSPQRNPLSKKKSSYGNRKTMPYVPSKNRPVTPNLQKQNSNLLSDNSESSNKANSFKFLGIGKFQSQVSSPQPFEFKRSQEPMINPFMVKDSENLKGDGNMQEIPSNFALVDTPLKTTEIETLHPNPRLSPTRTSKIENDQAITQNTPRFENRQYKQISSEKKEASKKQLFVDEPKPLSQKTTTPEKKLSAKKQAQKFKKVSQIECTVKLDTTLKEFESQGGQDFFKRNLSKSLGISQNEIEISSIREGSVIVDYTLTVDEDKHSEMEQLQQEKVNNGSIDFGFLIKDFSQKKEAETSVNESMLVTPPKRNQSHIERTPEDLHPKNLNLSYADFTDVEGPNFDQILEVRDKQLSVQNDDSESEDDKIAQEKEKQAQLDEEKRIKDEARAQQEKFRQEAESLKAQMEQERLERQKEKEQWDENAKKEFEEIKQKREQIEKEAEKQRKIDEEKRKEIEANAKAQLQEQQNMTKDELEKSIQLDHQEKFDQIAREKQDEEFKAQKELQEKLKNEQINAEKEAQKIKQQEILAMKVAEEEARLKKEVEDRREQLQQIRAQKQLELEQKEQAQKSSRLREEEEKRKQAEEAFFERQKDIEQRAKRSEFLRKKRQEAEEERLNRAKEAKEEREKLQREQVEKELEDARKKQEQIELEKQAAFKIQKEKKEAELRRIHEQKVASKQILDSPEQKNEKKAKSFRQYKTTQRFELKKEDEPVIETNTMSFKSTLKNFQTKNSYRAPLESQDEAKQKVLSATVANFEAEKQKLLEQIEKERQQKLKIEAQTKQSEQLFTKDKTQEEQQDQIRIMNEQLKSQQIMNCQIAQMIQAEMIKDQIVNVAQDTYQQIQIFEAEKEQERLRIEKEERQRGEILKRQQLAEKKIEQDRIKQMALKLEQEQQWLKQIAEENERKRMAVEEESQRLREEEESVRQLRLQQSQMVEEQQYEKQLLQKYNKQKEQKLELQKIQEDKMKAYNAQLQEEKCKQMKQEAEMQFEKERRIKIKNAQLELERLKNLRQEEEDKLLSIKQTYKEEEKIRKETIRKKIEEDANREEMNKYQAQIRQERLEEEAKFAAEAKASPGYKMLSGISPHRRDLSGPNVEAILKSGPRFSIPEEKSPTSYRVSIVLDQNQINNEDSAVSNKSSLVDSNIMTLVPSDLKGEEVEKYCDTIFKREAPIKFTLRKGNKLEEQIQKHIKKNKITIPIVWIRAQVYLVGTQRLTLENKFQAVMVRVGGGTERFDTYVPKNHRKFERQLVDYMSKSQMSLVWVIEKLMAGENIRKAINLPFQAKMMPNKHDSSIKKVNLNLHSRNVSNSSNNRSYESSPSAKVRINLNNHVSRSPTRNQGGQSKGISKFNVFNNQRLPSPKKQQDLENNMFGRMSPSRNTQQPFGQNIFKKVQINLNETGNSRASSASRGSTQMMGYIPGNSQTTWNQRSIE